MKLTKYFIPFLIFVPLALIQLSVVPYLTFEFIGPDILLIMTVYYSLKFGQVYGTVFGAVTGLCFDLISGGLLGSSMFVKTIAGFVAGFFFHENKVESNTFTPRFVFIVLLCAVINSLLLLILSAPGGTSNILALLFEGSLLPAIYTSVLSMAVIFIKPGKNRI